MAIDKSLGRMLFDHYMGRQHRPRETTLRGAALNTSPPETAVRKYRGLMLCALVLAACNPGHKATRPDKIKTGFTAPSFSRSAAGPAIRSWWLDLGSDELDRLVKKAAITNLDVVQAISRIEQSQAAIRIANAGFLPTLDVSANASKTRSVNPFFGANSANRFGLSAATSYEIDVWDRLGATKRAAQYDAQATALDMKALLMSLTAQIADTWLALIEQRATERLLKKQMKTNGTLLEVVEVRFENGLSQAADVLQQKQQLLATRSLLPQVLARKATLEHQLAVLIGRPPQEGHTLGGERIVLPDLSALPNLGIPSELLLNRPDLVSAQLRVAAADERVGAAIANRLPSFRLQASTGFSTFRLAELFDAWVWSLAGSVAGAVFDGGRRKAEVARTRAVLKGILAQFRSLYLNAMREVEDALVLEKQETERFRRLTEELVIARRVVIETQARYVEGIGSYLPVLTALQAEQRTERNHLAAKRQRISHRIRLYRALGGSWIKDIAPVGVVGAKRENQD